MAYRLELRQHITVMVNRWDLSRVAPTPAQLGYIEQKRMSLREARDLLGPVAANVLFTVQAENIIELAGKYVVADADGKQLARIEKDFRGSLAQSTYRVQTDGGTFTVREQGRGPGDPAAGVGNRRRLSVAAADLEFEVMRDGRRRRRLRSGASGRGCATSTTSTSTTTPLVVERVAAAMAVRGGRGS
jgi:hypothetical protein